MTKLFNPTFKQQCVDLMLATSHHRTSQQNDVRQHIGCNAGQQYLNEQQGITPKQPATTAEQREIQRLRAENEQLRSDNTLLKKLSAFLIDKQ